MEQIDKSSPGTVTEGDAAPVPGGYLGAVDDDRQGRISGWAITRQGDPCAVTATVNGQVFHAASDLPRPDLAAKGQSRGLGGWRIAIGDALVPGENRVAVCLPDGTPLAGSPRVVTVEAAPVAAGYLGAIDTASAALLSGWALTAAGDPCAVTVRIDDAEPVVVMADGLRADLAAKGMSAGAGGWHLFLDGRLRPGANRIAITLPDGSAVPGGPVVLDGGATEPVDVSTGGGVDGSADRLVDTSTTRRVDMPTPVLVVSRPAMPSLAELDEVSLDDLALAVASGRVAVEPHALPEPVAAVETVVAAGDAPAVRRGWWGRLAGR